MSSSEMQERDRCPKCGVNAYRQTSLADERGNESPGWWACDRCVFSEWDSEYAVRVGMAA